MEPGFILLVVVMTIIGVIVGLIIGKKTADRRYLRDTQYTQGTLNIDCGDPEFEPGIFLGLGVPVKDVIMRKYIILDINVLQKKSHE
jgi:hypothetical protein